MSSETWIQIAAIIGIFIAMVLAVPKTKVREAFVIFLFKLFMTWPVGLLVVQLGLIEYPVRLFAKGTSTSFAFEFFIYPAVCVIFNLHYPADKSFFRKFLHFFYFCSAIAVVEFFVERYTEIIQYIHWNWYLTWITLFLTFLFSRLFYKWFFRLKDNQR